MWSCYSSHRLLKISQRKICSNCSSSPKSFFTLPPCRVRRNVSKTCRGSLNWTLLISLNVRYGRWYQGWWSLPPPPSWNLTWIFTCINEPWLIATRNWTVANISFRCGSVWLIRLNTVNAFQGCCFTISRFILSSFNEQRIQKCRLKKKATREVVIFSY